MPSNRFFKYSYSYRTIYRGVNEYTLSNGRRTITVKVEEFSTDKRMRKLKDKLINFMYYVDNGNDAYSDFVSSKLVAFGADYLKCSREVFAKDMLDNFRSSSATPEKVISLFKQLSGLARVPNGFDYGNAVIALANVSNCKDTFEQIEDLV